MKKYNLEIDGKTVEVLAQKFKGKLWYHYNGETRFYEPELNYGSASSSAVSTEPGIIKSPMPGKIIKVSCSGGQEVKVGEALVIMEAMKMEYTLKADVNGVVENVNATAEALVAAGEVLVSIKASEED